MLVASVACSTCSQAFAPVRHRHVYTAEELLGNRVSNSPTRRKQQLVQRREGGIRTLRLHGTSDAKWCSSDDSSRDDYQGNCLDHELFEVMTRLDFGVGLSATGLAMLFGAIPTAQALADESTAVSENDRDPSPVVTETASRPAEEPSLRDLGFEVPYTGKSLPLSKFLGSKATLVVNPKIDDPESLNQVRTAIAILGLGGSSTLWFCIGRLISLSSLWLMTCVRPQKQHGGGAFSLFQSHLVFEIKLNCDLSYFFHSDIFCIPKRSRSSDPICRFL